MSYQTLSSQLMNDTTIDFSYIQQSQLRAVTIFYKSSMVPKIRSSNNLTRFDIAYPRTPEFIKVLPISYPTESPVLDQHAAKQNFSWDKSTPSRIQTYNLVTKERFCDKTNLSTLSKILEAMNIHATTNGVSTIVIRKLGCGMDEMNWQEVVKLLRDIFVYADVQVIVNTLEENGVHALSAEGDGEFYSDDEIER